MYQIGSSKRPDLPLAVVVGAGAMGTVIARRLAQSHRILLADIDGAKADQQAALMCDEGFDAAGVACDVTSPALVAALARTTGEMGGLGVLSFVAALAPAQDNFHHIIRVNIGGAACVAQAMLPFARQGSVATFISSMAAYRFPAPSPDVRALLRDPTATDLSEKIQAALGKDMATPLGAYTLSKWSLNDLCRRQAAAWGERGARIVSISPGIVASPMGAQEFKRNPSKYELFMKSPLKRECTMPEIADAVEFITSPRASFISGTDILVDGGLSAALDAESGT